MWNRLLTGLAHVSSLWLFMDEQVTKRRHVISHFESYEIYEHELTTLEQGESSHQNDLTFFSIAVTICLCFLTVWLTLPPPASQDGQPIVPLMRSEQYYFLAWIASGGIALYLFFQWKQSKKTAQNVCRAIRDRSVGTVGEQGKEIRLSDLAKNDAQPAPSGEGKP